MDEEIKTEVTVQYLFIDESTGETSDTLDPDQYRRLPQGCKWFKSAESAPDTAVELYKIAGGVVFRLDDF